MDFFKAFRKQGFLYTLQVLKEIGEDGALEKNFFRIFQEHGYFPNEFYRSKKDLIKFGLIEYKLDENINKRIYISKKGLKLLEIINELDDYIDKLKKEAEEDEKRI